MYRFGYHRTSVVVILHNIYHVPPPQTLQKILLGYMGPFQTWFPMWCLVFSPVRNMIYHPLNLGLEIQLGMHLFYVRCSILTLQSKKDEAISIDKVGPSERALIVLLRRHWRTSPHTCPSIYEIIKNIHFQGSRFVIINFRCGHVLLLLCPNLGRVFCCQRTLCSSFLTMVPRLDMVAASQKDLTQCECQIQLLFDWCAFRALL